MLRNDEVAVGGTLDEDGHEAAYRAAVEPLVVTVHSVLYGLDGQLGELLPNPADNPRYRLSFAGDRRCQALNCRAHQNLHIRRCPGRTVDASSPSGRASCVDITLPCRVVVWDAVGGATGLWPRRRR